tara:strand:+ start:1457 stop:1642 length:186 start_codon:yes stop_codon:yes gene_type:complete
MFNNWMSIDFNIGITIACVCIFIASITLIILFGCCQAIEEELGLSPSSSETNIVANPINNV